jgi:Dolichyl-phosphate-mannose-protein mannosyltransferase
VAQEPVTQGPVTREPVTQDLAPRGGGLDRLAAAAPLTTALILVGAAMAWNLPGYPGRVNDDEGTYVDRAWAMLATQHLSNYTYFWDHPFLGWATIAAWAGLTDGFARDSPSVLVGRELMWVSCLVSCVLLYVLARRVAIRRPLAATAVALFGLSPLGIFYHRMVSLDNLATVWVLAALVLAASRRQSWSAAIGSGACFAVAFWNKETVLLLLPAVAWLLWQHTDDSTRLANVSSFCVMCFSGIAFYPLLAILKGELLPGPGHNSLWGEQVVYQLTRHGTGSLLDVNSGTYLQFRNWLALDKWTVLGGAAAIVTGLLIRRLRPFAVALLACVAVMLKGGYVPYAFVTAMLPFAALLIAGTADACWLPVRDRLWPYRRRISRPVAVAIALTGRIPVIAAAALFVLAIAPRWLSSLEQQSTADGFGTQMAAVSWVAEHVPAGDIVVCDAYPWLDIKLRTHATPLYLWQIDSDPQVMRTELPDGYRDIAYLVLDPDSPLTFSALPGRPTLQQAISHATVVQRFGRMVIYQVRTR